jgi:hypothetical protein
VLRWADPRLTLNWTFDVLGSTMLWLKMLTGQMGTTYKPKILMKLMGFKVMHNFLILGLPSTKFYLL